MERLLTTCDSILRLSKSYQTLAVSFAAATESSSTTEETRHRLSLHFECTVAHWLDEKILDFERVRCKPTPSNSTNEEKKQQLLLSITRVHLDHRLLQRYLIARQASSLDTSSLSTSSNSSSSHVLHRSFLIKEAVAAKNRLVHDSLHLQQELLQLKQQVRNIRDECHVLSTKNRQLWKDNNSFVPACLQRGSSTFPLPPNIITTTIATTTSKSIKEEENSVLHRFLVDLVVSSSLDWYLDDRLRIIMTRAAPEPVSLSSTSYPTDVPAS